MAALPAPTYSAGAMNAHVTPSLHYARRALAAALAFGLGMNAASVAKADEGGVSMWLPGFFGSLAATPLQPGWALGTVYYHPSVAASGNVACVHSARNSPATTRVRPHCATATRSTTKTLTSSTGRFCSASSVPPAMANGNALRN